MAEITVDILMLLIISGFVAAIMFAMIIVMINEDII